MTADRAAPASLHDRIVAEIEARIVSGDWPPGQRIPFEHALMEQYGCSRMTVNKALTELVRRGWIVRRRKSGSHVRHPQSRSAVMDIRDIESEVTALGHPYRFDCLARHRRTADADDRARLRLSQSGEVVAFLIRHFAGDRPFCIEDRIISLAAVPEAADEPFDRLAPGPWLIRRVPWSAAEHRIRAVGATPAIARQLAIPVGTACLVVERRTSNNEVPVTHVALTYPGDSHELIAQFSPGRT